MSLITTVAPNGTISGPLPNTLPQALALATAISETSPAARSLLQSAVTATNLVPNYQEPRAFKATIRNPANTAPSSQLAAQYIAQSPEASDEELAIFDKRPQTPSQNATEQSAPQDDFLAALRAARGDAPPAANTNTPPPAAAAAQANNAVATSSNILNFATQTAVIAATSKPLPNYEARALPALTTPAGGRKPGLVQSRGASAYQLAAARNESSTAISAGVNAFL